MRFGAPFILVVAVLMALAPPPGIARSASGPGVQGRLVLPGVSSDNQPAANCDPSNPSAGVQIEEVHAATIAGYDGQVFAGLMANDCAAAMSNVAAAAVMFDAGQHEVGITYFHPYFGLIPASGVSPFFVVVPPGNSTVTSMGFVVLRSSSPQGALPQVTLVTGAATSGPDGATVAYTVRNDGNGPASVPRIAGRLQGLGCTSPFAIEDLQDSAALAPGQSITGSLFIPGSCGGIPAVYAGSDASPSQHLPASIAAASASVSYSGSNLQLVASVCNNSGNSYDRPALRGAFSGPTGSVELDLPGSGYYPAGACAPLISTIPNAPEGLTFNRLIGPGQALSAIESAASVTSQERSDPYEEAFRKAEDRNDEDLPPFWWILLPFAASRWSNQDLNPPPPATGAAPADPSAADSTTATGKSQLLAAGGTPGATTLISVVYNQNPGPIPAAAYRILVLGENDAGQAVAGVVVNDPPALSAHGWGIGITDLTQANVVAAPGTSFHIAPIGVAD